MNKTELIAAIAEKAELSKKDSEKALNAALSAITEELAQGGKVQLIGFGSFETKTAPPAQAAIPAPKKPFPFPPALIPCSRPARL